MNFSISALLSAASHLLVPAALVAALFFFVKQFFIPARRVGKELKLAHERLTELSASGAVLDLDTVRVQVMVSDAMRLCWDEFRDTLHGQKKPNAAGMMEVTRWRATASANGFFTEQALVDAPLHTEFYKHLPGILTGIGIIGTFLGLILGLQAFGLVDLGDAATARLGLQALLGTVGSAFIVSGTAIALAMVLTTVEKQLINRRYTELERLCGLIDSLFDAGAGEEYLQRLVEAAETSATQTMQMKESLVTDLKQVLTELAHQQIEAMTTTSANLGGVITRGLKAGLKDPLKTISDAVQAVSTNQGDAVNKLLTDVLTNFTAQMENMFGGQMRGMSEMLTQTASTIQMASQRFEQLAANIQQAGAGATEAMAKRMDEALAQMQSRQNDANEQMRAFIEQMRQNVAKGQSESAELTMAMMKELGESTRSLVRGLEDQSRSAGLDHAKRQLEATEQMRGFMEQLKDSLAQGQSQSGEAMVKLLKEMGETAESLVRSLQDQASGAQQAHSARQLEATERMRDLMEQLRDSMAKGQSASADAMVKLLREMADTTAALVAKLQSQSDAAQKIHIESQKAVGDQFDGSVKRLSDAAAKAQADTSESVARVLKELGETTAAMVRGLQEQAKAAQAESSSSQAATAAQTTAMLADQSEQIARLTAAVQQTQAAMRDTVDRLKASTDSHLERMGVGAERLLGASDRLSDNLGLMKAAGDGIHGSAQRLTESASVLTSALTATQRALDEQKLVRDALAAMVTDLRATVDNARREASVTSQLVAGLERATERLTSAQVATVSNLEEATEAIGAAHGAFAKQVEVTLRDGNRVFHEELAHATGLLKGAIQDLGAVLDSLPLAS